MIITSGNVLPFRQKTRDCSDAWSEAAQCEHLILLHDYLEAALIRQKENGTTRVTLCIDDIVLLCEMIESRVGREHFNDDIG